MKKIIVSSLILLLSSCSTEDCDIKINPLWIQGLSPNQIVFEFDCDADVVPASASPNGKFDTQVNISAKEIYRVGNASSVNFAIARANALQLAQQKFLNIAKLQNSSIINAYFIRCKEISSLKPNTINTCPQDTTSSGQQVDNFPPPVTNPNPAGGDFDNGI